MAVDEHGRHRLHRRLEEVLGPEEAGILMEHLPPRGFGDLATKGDLELMRAATKADIDGLRAATKADIDGLRAATKADIDGLRVATKGDIDGLRHELRGDIERSARHMMVWVSSMVLAVGGLAFTAAHLV